MAEWTDELALKWKERAEAAEAKLAEIQGLQGVAWAETAHAKARLAEAQAERMLAYAEYRRAEADLAAERAKTAKLVEALEAIRHLAWAGDSLDEDEQAFELADAALAAAKASE